MRSWVPTPVTDGRTLGSWSHQALSSEADSVVWQPLCKDLGLPIRSQCAVMGTGFCDGGAWEASERPQSAWGFPTSPWVLGPARHPPTASSPQTPGPVASLHGLTLPSVETRGRRILHGLDGVPHWPSSWTSSLWKDSDPSLVWGTETGGTTLVWGSGRWACSSMGGYLATALAD